MEPETDGTATAWAALGGDPRLTSDVAYVGRYAGPAAPLSARLPVMALARSTVAVCSLAAAELAARRTGGPLPAVTVDDGAVITAFLSERHLQVNGRAPVSFAPLSRFWRTADGWLRTHANYPHHRTRLLAALGIQDHGDDGALAEQIAAELAGRRVEEIEETVYAAGGLAVAVREPKEWAAHPAGVAAAARPLVARERIGDAPVRALAALPAGAGPVLPAAGICVLDLTRVLAGPVATRTLALLGADVLRIDPPRFPESQDMYSDTGFGKRSCSLDLGTPTGRAAFEELLAGADVVVTGYRPGALDQYGLAPHALAERRPGLVIAQVSAWGTSGPWAGRRGFDSLVQAACGIAVTESGPAHQHDRRDPDGRPGALPAQALDHGTGYLLAAAVLRALTEQLDSGGTRLATLALARTATWLLSGVGEPSAGVRAAPRPYDAEEWLTESTGPLGRLRHARTPVSFAGSPAHWSRPPGRLGADAPAWS